MIFLSLCFPILVAGDTFVTAIVSGICPLDNTEEEELDEARKSQIGSSVRDNSSYAYASDHFGESPEMLYNQEMLYNPSGSTRSNPPSRKHHHESRQ
jgi:hypothetical protein